MTGFGIMSSFIQVVTSQNELQLLGRVEKSVTLNLCNSAFLKICIFGKTNVCPSDWLVSQLIEKGTCY